MLKRIKEEIEARFWMVAAKCMRGFLGWAMEYCGDEMSVEDYLECRRTREELDEVIKMANGVEEQNEVA